MATVQGGGVNQGVITAMAGKFTNRNLRAGAFDGTLFLQPCRVQVIFLRLFHLSVNSGIHTHRNFQNQDTAIMHHKV